MNGLTLETDSSLIALFRVFVAIRVAFAALSLALERLLPSPRFQRLQPVWWLGLGEALFLLGYLSWPWLRRRLGRFYLPIGLLVATLGPVVENYLAANPVAGDEVVQARAFAGQWQTIILLLVPLILVSWRYNLKILAGYSFGLAILDVGLFFTRTSALVPHLWPAAGVVLFRTLTFLLVGFFINRLALEQRAQTARLVAANRQLAGNARSLEQLATSRERNRLARELHDTLAHSLSALAVQLEATRALWDSDPSQARSMLDHSLTITREGLNDARRAIQALRTAPLEDLGLPLAIRSLAASQAERGGFQVSLNLPADSLNLAPEVEHSLYRITEEALRNAGAHAGAHHVAICLAPDDDHLELSIQDDGRGFASPSAAEDHFGLQGMRERAEAIGARLAIDSQPGQGTTVRLCMEMKHDPGLDL